MRLFFSFGKAAESFGLCTILELMYCILVWTVEPNVFRLFQVGCKPDVFGGACVYD